MGRGLACKAILNPKPQTLCVAGLVFQERTFVQTLKGMARAAKAGSEARGTRGCLVPRVGG